MGKRTELSLRTAPTLFWVMEAKETRRGDLGVEAMREAARMPEERMAKIETPMETPFVYCSSCNYQYGKSNAPPAADGPSQPSHAVPRPHFHLALRHPPPSSPLPPAHSLRRLPRACQTPPPAHS